MNREDTKIAGYAAYENILRNNFKDLPESLKQSEEYQPEKIVKPDEWKEEQPVKSLTPQQEEKLKRYDKLHFEKLSDDWEEEHQKLIDNQEKHTDYDEIKKERDNWTSTFPELSHIEVKEVYDQPKETHKPEDLKPTDLPNDWKTELERIPNLEKRPTQNQLDQAVQQKENEYKEHVLLSDDDKVKIRNYDGLDNDLKQWTTVFPNEKPNEVKTKYDEPKKPADYDDIKNERDNWVNSFPKPLTPQQVKTKYDEPEGTKLTPEQQEKINIPITKNQWDADYSLRPSKNDYEQANKKADISQKRMAEVVSLLKVLMKEKV